MRPSLFAVCLAATLFTLSAATWAEQDKRPRPTGLQPLPSEAPPPPAASGADAALEPQITIVTKEGQKTEEYRINGRLYMMKVTPKIGAPYYLIDQRGDGQFSRQDHLDTGLRVPMWVLRTF